MSLPRAGSTVWLVVFAVCLVVAVILGVSGRSGGGAAWAAAAAFAVALVHHGRLWLTARRPLPASVHPVSEWHQVQRALEAPSALLFKHSPACPVSARALGQVWSFAGSHPGSRVLQLDVLERRQLSRQVADELQVKHESPQVIVLRDGAVQEVLNHGGVREDRLAQALASAGDSAAG